MLVLVRFVVRLASLYYPLYFPFDVDISRASELPITAHTSANNGRSAGQLARHCQFKEIVYSIYTVYTVALFFVNMEVRTFGRRMCFKPIEQGFSLYFAWHHHF